MSDISSKKLIVLLRGIGYRVARRGRQQVRLEKNTRAGVHSLTIPYIPAITPALLNEIFCTISLWSQVSKEELFEMLRQ